jgi:ketosteroid isomerase-like protein
MNELTETVLAAYDSFNRGEVEPMLDLMHPDIEWVPPPTSLEPHSLHGVEAVREYLAPNFFESQTAEPLETIEHGNRLLVVAQVRARGRGSGIEIDQTAYHVLTIEDGRAVRFEVHVDRATALAALAQRPTTNVVDAHDDLAMTRVLEEGHVFFFYRPRVGTDEVRSLDDVQRFFVVLEPHRRRLFRRLVVGRKRLPEVHARERVWAFVAEVADDPDALHDDLKRVAYETRTRGARVQPEARPAGEGRYAVVDHEGHTHFVYVLELPPEPAEAQRMLRIEPEASYVVAVRNPDAPAPPGTGLPERRRPEYPQELRARFGERRFSPVDPPELLDYEGAEVVIIGAAEDAAEELGIELDPETERVEDADLFRKLRVSREELPVEPLDRGELR